MTAFFTELFSYNRWCNQQLVATLSGYGPQTGEKVISLFSHILNAHQIWNSRIKQEVPTVGVWDLRPVGTWEEADARNYANTCSILKEADQSSVVSYTNSSGRRFTNRVSDILFHVVNHSTYHRGQIALLLRQQGLEPILSDYIFYKR